MLTILGSIAVSVMVLAHALEDRSQWFVAVFAGASAATAIYSGFAEVCPITVIEAIWAVIAARRFLRLRREAVCLSTGLGRTGRMRFDR